MVNLSLTQQQYRKLKNTLVDAIAQYQMTATEHRVRGEMELWQDYDKRQREVRNLYLTLLKTATEYSIVEE